MRLFHIVIVLTLVTLVLEIMHIHVLNQVNADGLVVSKLKSEIKHVEEENAELKIEILEKTSLTLIASKAAALGFVEPKDSISLSTPLQVAVRNE